jgi:hypothetical protein
MQAEELTALARAVESLSAIAEDLLSRKEYEVYNHLVIRFRERVTLALNRWRLGQEIEPELTQELRLMTRALPSVLRRAEAAIKANSGE